MNKLTIEIESFNPYDAIFPNRKVVSKDTLRLIKTLRLEGYEVIVKPRDDRPLEYLFKKGEVSFLADPAVQLMISVPLSIITGLITNWIQKQIETDKKSKNVLIIDRSKNTIVDLNQNRISLNEVRDSKKKRKAFAKEMEICLTTKSPIPGLHIPILLEHQPKIIGWCRLVNTEKALEIEKGIITDKNVYRKMQNGKYKGGSITGIAKISECNICKGNYTACDHLSGELYDGVHCTNTIIEADFIEVSVVKEPINPQTFIKLF